MFYTDLSQLSTNSLYIWNTSSRYGNVAMLMKSNIDELKWTDFWKYLASSQFYDICFSAMQLSPHTQLLYT